MLTIDLVMTNHNKEIEISHANTSIGLEIPIVYIPMPFSIYTNKNLLEQYCNIIRKHMQGSICNTPLTKYQTDIFEIFNTQTIPIMPTYEYVIRIYAKMECNINILVMSLIYISRLREKTSLTLTVFNIYKLMLISMIVGIKYTDDMFYTGNEYAKIGGIPLDEYILLEQTFLVVLGFDLWIDFVEFSNVYNELYNN